MRYRGSVAEGLRNGGGVPQDSQTGSSQQMRLYEAESILTIEP